MLLTAQRHALEKLLTTGAVHEEASAMPVTRFRSASLLLPYVLAVAVFSLSACAVYEKPRVRVLGADVTDVSLTSADLVFDVAVENPNRFAFVLDTVDYRLQVNGEPFLDGQSDLHAEVAARGTTEVRLPVKLRFTDVLRVLHAVEGEKRAGYDLEAKLWFQAPLVGRRSVPVRKRGDFSLADIQLGLPGAP
jgi:LEA14-like dessication related protein